MQVKTITREFMSPVLVVESDTGEELGRLIVASVGAGVHSHHDYNGRIALIMDAIMLAFRTSGHVYKGPLPEVGGTYRHFRKGEYLVTAIARCSETLNYRVIYEPLDSHERLEDFRVWHWDRPASMWYDVIKEDGTTRFTKVG